MTCVTADPVHDAELHALYRCTDARHLDAGECFSAAHLSLNHVAFQASWHGRDCGCWQHAVLRHVSWPTVTGQPGSPHVVFEDRSLAHQLRLMFAGASGAITLTCNCRRNPRTGSLVPIESRKVFPAAGAVTAWRAWHTAQGLGVTS